MTKSTYQIKDVDTSTGEEIMRNASNEEIAIIEADILESKNIRIAEENRLAAKQAAIAKLGLTAEEAAALLA